MTLETATEANCARGLKLAREFRGLDSAEEEEAAGSKCEWVREDLEKRIERLEQSLRKANDALSDYSALNRTLQLEVDLKKQCQDISVPELQIEVANAKVEAKNCDKMLQVRATKRIHYRRMRLSVNALDLQKSANADLFYARAV